MLVYLCNSSEMGGVRGQKPEDTNSYYITISLAHQCCRDYGPSRCSLDSRASAAK